MAETEATIIPQKLRVFYDVYANLPTLGVSVNELGYATDRLVLYRWSGTTWEFLTFHFSSGIAANIPTAADLPDGSFYFTTDTNLLRQVQGGAWVAIIIHSSSGVIGDIPAIANMPLGSLYYATDTLRLWQNQAGVWVDITPISGLTEVEVIARLAKDGLVAAELATVSDFQANPATGTFTINPERINDNDTGNFGTPSAVGEYAEVDFGKLVVIQRWRWYGDTGNSTGNVYKFEYWDIVSAAWEDWVTGIAVRETGDWSSFITETRRITTKVKFTLTARNAPNEAMIKEMEVIF